MIQALVKGIMAFGTKLLVSLGSEKLIEWAFFYVAQQIVKSTATKHDDEFLEKVMKNFQEKK